MNDSEWESKLKGFLKKTGADLKRLGRDVKEEADKLMLDVQDPVRKERLKNEVTGLAKRVAEDVTSLMDVGIKKAEGALGEAQKRAAEFISKPTSGQSSKASQSAAAPTPPSAPPKHEETAERDIPKPKRSAPAKKTVGVGTKTKPVTKKRVIKKSIGK